MKNKKRQKWEYFALIISIAGLICFFSIKSNGQPKNTSDTVRVKFLVSNLANMLQVIDGYVITVSEWRDQYETRHGDLIYINDAGYYPISSKSVRKDYSLFPENLTIWQIKRTETITPQIK